MNTYIEFQNRRKNLLNILGDGIAIIDNNDNIMQFLSYEGTFEAKDGPALGILSKNISVSQSNSPEGKSMQLTSSGNNYDDFTWKLEDNTYGRINMGQNFLGEQDPSAVQVSEPYLQFPFILLIITLLFSRKRLNNGVIRRRAIL